MSVRVAYPSLVVLALLAGLLLSYRIWAAGSAAAAHPDGIISKSATDLDTVRQQVDPPGGYRLGVRYGDLGPKLLAAGVIDYDAFAAIYSGAGQPLNPEQVNILVHGSDEQIVLNRENAHFLLNYFWAVGLANRNPILTDGPMTQYSAGDITRFASTGGWGIGAKPIEDLYASMDLIELTDLQQGHVLDVASAVYRPCCDNPTSFPDCNHGMAMLGLLELMASQNATEDEMFTAAKYANAYWFPSQALETGLYLQAIDGIAFAKADPRLLTGQALASGSGFAALHRDLQSRGLLPESNDRSGSCAN